MPIELTAVFREVPEGGYIAWVEEIPGALTQGETLEETRENLEDATRLLIDEFRSRTEEEAAAGAVLVREPLIIDVPRG
jgi:predicted RNase H-like HicB family nuclease